MCIYKHRCVCIRICICVCIYIYIYTHTYIRVYMYRCIIMNTLFCTMHYSVLYHIMKHHIIALPTHTARSAPCPREVLHILVQTSQGKDRCHTMILYTIHYYIIVLLD